MPESQLDQSLSSSSPSQPIWSKGGKFNAFVETGYDDLRLRARKAMLGFPGAVTLQPTAVVNEAIIKVFKGAKSEKLQSRCDFMLAISRAMRDVLIDNLRQRTSLKRGVKRPLELKPDVAEESTAEEIVELKLAIESLRESESRQAAAIEMQHFGGFSVREIAAALRVSIATIERDIVSARGNLYSMLAE